MINPNKIVSVIEGYKQYFPEHWEDEKYKWEAVKHFQDNWDIDAPNFGEMFAKATSKAGNLLVSKNVYPTGVILEFARADDNATREMFRNLFDENLDLAERITEFRTRSEEMRQKYGNGEWKNHYQTINYISTYLWLKYPDKYYIYKYMIFKECAALFDDSYSPKANGAVDNVIGGFQMYDEIRKVLMADDEFREMLSSALTDLCYPDPEFVTATIDFGFYTARYYNKENEWIPSLEEYAPGLSVEDWVELLRNPEVFDENSMFLVKAFYDMGGQATCSEIAEKYGDVPMHYAGIATGLARRVQKETNCPLSERDTGEDRLWSVLFTGKKADSADKGVFIWKLRDELKEAVEIMMNDAETGTINAWLLTYNPAKWDWEDYDNAIKITRNGIGYYCDWNCSNQSAKVGDRVFIVKLGDKSTPKGIFATGYIVSDFYEGDNFDITKDNKIKYIDIILTHVVDYRTDSIITLDELNEKFPEQHWSPQGSGIAIKPEAAKWLIDNWKNAYTIDNDVNINAWLLSWNPIFGDSLNIGFIDYDDVVKDIKSGKGVWCSWTCANRSAKIGDRVFLSRLGGQNTIRGIVATGYVISDYFKNDNDPNERARYIYVIFTDLFDFRTERIIRYEELLKRFPEQKWNPQGSGIAIKPEAAKWLIEHWNDYRNDSTEVFHYTSYFKSDFLKEVFLTESEYDKLHSLVLRKKNIILQGAPGVGKTFSAKRLAYSIIGEKNESRICMVQFHQNYSYEDFIMGYRPNDNGGFELQNGVFFNFCERCKENPDKPYFFIIDEINRGNLSKIFGELLMLIETDMRGEKHKLNLVYGGTAFYIPENLHIIGMMNTADRSLAMIDYALRRRFSFYTMQPAFENADQNGFGAYTQDISCDLYHSVITKIRELNDTIRKDSTLGKGFEIGHSYFAPENKSEINDEWVRGVVEYEIIPLIEEYWFDDDKKVDEWTKALYQVIGDQNDR